MRRQVIWYCLLQVLLQCNGASGTSIPRVKKHSFASPLLQLQSLGDRDHLVALERDSGRVWASQDMAQSWTAVQQGSGVRQLIPHPHDALIAFALTTGSTHWLTRDKGASWARFDLPNGTTPCFTRGEGVLGFSATNWGTVIVNARSCDESSCRDVALYTKDGFETVSVLRKDAHSCKLFPIGSERIICVDKILSSRIENEYRPVLTTDWFHSEVDLLSGIQDGIKGRIKLTIQSDIAVFLLEEHSGQGTKLLNSKNGFIWHQASFSPEVKFLPDDILFLDPPSSSLAVAIKDEQGNTAMYRSDSSATHFTQTVPHLRTDWIIRNAEVERASHLQGITIINQPIEQDMESSESPRSPQAQSMISFLDSRAGSFQPMRLDTDDLQMQSEFFSRDASGLMMGVGNNGSHLVDYADSDLYISRNAGRHWFKALSGTHMYEFGDNGNVLAAVRDRGPTDRLAFSIDHGLSWQNVLLDSVETFRPLYLSAIPDSASLQMMLMAVGSGHSEQDAYLFVVDFSNVLGRTCGAEDLEVFRPLRDQESCVMGQKQAAWRRKADADCFVRSVKLEMDESLLERCPCTHADYETIFARPDDEVQCHNLQCSDVLGSMSPEISDAGLLGVPQRLIPGNRCTSDQSQLGEEDKVTRPLAGADARRVHRLSLKLGLKILLVVALSLAVTACAAFWTNGGIPCSAALLCIATSGHRVQQNEDQRGKYKEIHDDTDSV